MKYKFNLNFHHLYLLIDGNYYFFVFPLNLLLVANLSVVALYVTIFGSWILSTREFIFPYFEFKFIYFDCTFKVNCFGWEYPDIVG